MDQFLETMIEFGFSIETAEVLKKYTNNPSEAIEIIENKQQIINALLDLGIDENLALRQALLHSTAEEAAQSIYQTIKSRRPKKPNPVPIENEIKTVDNKDIYTYSQSDENQPLEIIFDEKETGYRHEAFIENEKVQEMNKKDFFMPNETQMAIENPNFSSNSIYFAGPDVVIPGKEVIPVNRDQMISYYIDEFGKKPLNENKRNLMEIKTIIEQPKEQVLCSICLESMILHQIIVILPCKHYFHKECIENNFKHNNRCPIDNLEI